MPGCFWQAFATAATPRRPSPGGQDRPTGGGQRAGPVRPGGGPCRSDGSRPGHFGEVVTGAGGAGGGRGAGEGPSCPWKRQLAGAVLPAVGGLEFPGGDVRPLRRADGGRGSVLRGLWRCPGRLSVVW